MIPPADRTLLAAHELSTGYRGLFGVRPVLHGLSFELPLGSISALVGLNGAGKTTLLLTLAGFLPPRAGKVQIAGLVPRAYRLLRGVGFLPESVRLPPGFTVSSFLEVGARRMDVPSNEVGDRVEGALRAGGLEVERDTLLTKLSKGNARRVALEWSLMGHPELLFLDEPESGLDLRSRRALRARIESAREEGATVLLSCHDLAEVRRMADRILVLDAGRLVRSLTSAEITAGDMEALLLADPEELD